MYMKKPRSFHLQWHITDKCNLKCKHCYSDVRVKDLDTEKLFLVLDQYVDMIKKWKMDKEKRIRKLSITGGEPLVRKDFFSLLKGINEERDMFTSLIVMSNGTTIDARTARRMKDLNVSAVQISLDGLEKTNDAIRGRGCFKKAVGGIKRLIDNEMRVGISMTLVKSNVKDVPGMIGLCKELGVGLGIGRLVPMGRGKSLEMLSPTELKEFYGYIMREKRKKGIRISTHCSDSLWFIEDPNHMTHGCSAGYDSFSVLPNGDVVPCRRLPIRVGNVMEKRLFDIWYTSQDLWNLRDRNMMNSVCRECGIFDKCFGGAKCIAYGHSNDAFAPDPQCWRLSDKILEKKSFRPGKTEKIRLSEEYLCDF